MTNVMDCLVNMITTKVRNEYPDRLPTIKEIDEQAGICREICKSLYPVTDEEFQAILLHLQSEIRHDIDHAISLKGKRDSAHKPWYGLHTDDGFYWKRYGEYLRAVKRWGKVIVDRLDETTNSIMDDLGDPTNERPFQRRGLLLGSVQSGKTATYTALCAKAADAGYRVIIVLAGMMENLRVQTQGRLDLELVGKESKYVLDKKRRGTASNDPVGVGRIPPFDGKKRISCFTSVGTDFRKSVLDGLGLSLKSLSGTALFVVKKNKAVLNHLIDWIKENNITPESPMVDLPLLLLDDEADNASVNTNADGRDPTAINKAIRDLLKLFKQASYVGVTATPFANIFIDPELDEDGAARDLFPRDFLTALPTPEHYIGPEKIFKEGRSETVQFIDDSEQDGFFAFGHTAALANELHDLPPSLKKAILYFFLVTGISDYRNDATCHRSMLVNVTRFTLVQNALKHVIEEFVFGVRADVQSYALKSEDEIKDIPSLMTMHKIWDEFGLGEKSGLSWDSFRKKYLYPAVKRIEVRAVNQTTGPNSLDYYNYEKGMRVIAVGGNGLSRGLTIEGLCCSYFYRNTAMYDTLLQMGRWFGYRPNYEDLCQIWMGQDSYDWFGCISDAVIELRHELSRMKDQNQTPDDFGLKVKRSPTALMVMANRTIRLEVTARNKMRNGVVVNRPITVSGRMLETPRLRLSAIDDNVKIGLAFLKRIVAARAIENDECTSAYIIRNVPKSEVSALVKSFLTHPWNLNFQPIALAEYLDGSETGLEMWDVGIPQGTGPKFVDAGTTYNLVDKDGRVVSFSTEPRPVEKDRVMKDLLKVNGHHVRVGSGSCAKTGLTKAEVDRVNADGAGKTSDEKYLFEGRARPIMLMHFIHCTGNVPDCPKFALALGLGFPKSGDEKTASYVVNPRELRNWIEVDITDPEEDDDDDKINSDN